MGDLLLKQKPPIPPHWQSAEMLTKRPHPAMYHKGHKNGFPPPFPPNLRISEPHYPFFHPADPPPFGRPPGEPPYRPPVDPSFRHSDPPFVRDPPFRPSDYPKFRETGYYPTPVFNHPPRPPADHYFLAPYYRNAMPPPPPHPNRLLMVDTRRRLSVSTTNGHPPCKCRSRSMEDVRTDVVEMREDRWLKERNGTKSVSPSVKGSAAEKFVSKFGDRRSMDNLLMDYTPGRKRSGRIYVRFQSKIIL